MQTHRIMIIYLHPQIMTW